MARPRVAIKEAMDFTELAKPMEKSNSQKKVPAPPPQLYTEHDVYGMEKFH